MLYYTLVYSKLQYGFLAWGKAVMKYLNEIPVNMNKIVLAKTKNSSRYSSLSPLYKNLNFLKEIQLEIGLIEEMRTIWENKEVPQTFFQNPLHSQKYVLHCLTPYHWQFCISQFCDITKGLL